MRGFCNRAIWIFCIWVFPFLFITACSTAEHRAEKTEQSTVPMVQAQAEPSLEPEASPSFPTKISEPQKKSPFVHTVQYPGETLSYISKWYTGRFSNWKLLAKANPVINPNKIKMGEEILIPDQLLRQRTPLPKNFLTKITPKKATSAPKSTRHSQKGVSSKDQTGGKKKTTELPLFGPIQ